MLPGDSQCHGEVMLDRNQRLIILYNVADRHNFPQHLFSSTGAFSHTAVRCIWQNIQGFLSK